MELVGIAAVVVVLIVGMVALVVAWWALRRAISLIKGIVMLGLLFALVAGMVAAGSAGAMFWFGSETPAPADGSGLHPPGNPRK